MTDSNRTLSKPPAEEPWKIGRGGAVWYVPIAPYDCERTEDHMTDFGERVPELAGPVRREVHFPLRQPAPIREALRRGDAITLDLRSQRAVEFAMSNIELVVTEGSAPDRTAARRAVEAIGAAGRRPSMADAVNVLLGSPSSAEHDQERYAWMTGRFISALGPLLLLGAVHLRWASPYAHLRDQGSGWGDFDLLGGF